MNEEIFNNLSDMLNNSKTTHNSANTNSSNNSSSYNNYSNSNYSDIFNNVMPNFSSDNNSNSNFDFSNIDIETIMKIKNIMGKMTSNQHNPRSNLLSSLKPYLKPSKRQKLDQYMQFMNIASIMENFNKTGGEK